MHRRETSFSDLLAITPALDSQPPSFGWELRRIGRLDSRPRPLSSPSTPPRPLQNQKRGYDRHTYTSHSFTVVAAMVVVVVVPSNYCYGRYSTKDHIEHGSILAKGTDGLVDQN